MTAIFNQQTVEINSIGEVEKSEDGETFFQISSGGQFFDSALCLSSEFENFYFYRGDGETIVVPCKLS